MKDLISEKDVVNVANLHKYRLEITAKALMKIFGLHKVNDFYKKISDKKGLAFIEAVFEQLNITLNVSEADLANIPDTGKFIVVCNHPFGALDGLILMHIIGSKRPDFKVMANFLLKEIDAISDFFIGVNPFEDVKNTSSYSGIKAALEHINEDKPLGLFPAGEVSSYQTNSRKITDRQWSTSALKLVKKAEVPVVPVYFSGQNSLIFHLLGFINPRLRTAALPTEMLKKKNQTLTVRIGKPISVREQKNFDKSGMYGRFLRAKTYALASSLEVKKFYIPRPRIAPINKEEAKPIIDAVPKDKILAEFAALPKGALVTSQMEFDVYIAYSTDIPNILNEIGRLREITFRAVGEGTNNAIDVDEYDLYYHHLILWDREAQKIAGGYRIGKGNDILTKFGINGFYTQSLFKMSKKFKPVLSQTIELGRSYVAQEYQAKRLPLFLLWKGIMHFLLSNPEYRYILGPVSISNNYSKVSKQLMVAFIKKYYYNEEMASWVKPLKPFKGNIKNTEIKELLENTGNNLKDLDKLIGDIEPWQATVPVLLKKYINQNAKIISFNVDPKFNYALDGLMILDLHDLPADSIENLRDDLNKNLG